MRSRTSCFEPTLLKKNISRFAVLWAVFTGVLFLFCTMPFLNGEKAVYEDNLIYGLGVFATAVYAVICASVCFSYLHKTRSTYMLHAFPVTRGRLFLTNLLSGFLFALVPETLITLINFLISSVRGYGLSAEIFQLLGAGLLEYLYFYGLAVACMVLTGRTVYGVLGYIAATFALPAMEATLRGIFNPLLYGIVDMNAAVTAPLCPLVGIFGYSMPNYDTMLLTIGQWLYLVAVGAAGAVLMVLAWLMYRKRHMENAGEAIAFRWARPVFKYGFTVFITLLLGTVIMAICGISDMEYSADYFPGMVISLLIAGFVGYFSAEMILKRTARVWKKKAFFGFAVYALLLLELVFSAKCDLFGIVRRVPQAQEISSFALTSENGITLCFDTQEDAEAVTELHRIVIAEHRDKPYNLAYNYDDGASWKIKLTYRLKNGSSFSRTYPCSTDWIGLAAREDAIRSYYEDFRLGAQNGGKLSYFADGESAFAYLNAEQMQKLAELLQEDLSDSDIDFKKYSETIYLRNHSAYYIRLSDGKTVCIPEASERAYAYLEKYEH